MTRLKDTLQTLTLKPLYGNAAGDAVPMALSVIPFR